MYTASVEDGFHAAHHVRMPDGTWENPHWHNWRVRACFACTDLDEFEMVVDFCEVEAALRAILGPLDGADLNGHEAFAGRSPTAELVARHIFDQLVHRGFELLIRVEVTEAPGCAASYGREAGKPA